MALLVYFGGQPNSCTWHLYRTTTNTCWCTWAVLAAFLATLPFHHQHPAVGRTSSEFPWTAQHVIRVPRRYCPEIARLMLHVILHPQIDPKSIPIASTPKPDHQKVQTNLPKIIGVMSHVILHLQIDPNASTTKAKRCKLISKGDYILRGRFQDKVIVKDKVSVEITLSIN